MSLGYDNKGMDVGNGTMKIVDESQVNVSFRKDGPSGKRTNLEKGLIFLVAIFVLAVIGLIIAFVLVKRDTDDEKPSSGKCENQACLLAAAQLLDDMDLSVDPCEDFYLYACGKWKKKNHIPGGWSWYSVHSEVYLSVEALTKSLLEDKKPFPQESAGTQVAKDMYASCVDMDKINADGITAALPLLEELGGWPVLCSNPGGNWSESSFSLPQLLILLMKYNNKPLINLYVGSDVKETDKNIIYLDQPYLGLSTSYYLYDSLSHVHDAYVSFATYVAVTFGANETTADMEMKEMFALETEIANISMTSIERQDSEALYNKMTIAELKENITEPLSTEPIQFDWMEYIRGVFDLEGVKIPITEDEDVVVRALPYFRKLFGVLQKHGKRAISNYLVWYIMMSRTRNLDSRFTDRLASFNKFMYGRTYFNDERWEDCISYTRSNFGFAVGYMLVKETFDDDARTEATDMIFNIKTVFIELLDELGWMDTPTKKLAREKAKAMTAYVGFPENFTEPGKIDKLYEKFTINKDEYFQNVLNVLMTSSADSLDLLRQTQKDEWFTYPTTVNGYYNVYRNELDYPAGIFQPPYFREGRPKSMNYGSMGFTIAHEITHGFDEQGSRYDKNGKFEPWWGPNVSDNFMAQSQCVVDQYGGFKVPDVDLNVDGMKTLAENIADVAGIKQSFRAYRKWVDKQGYEEPMLPNLNFTNNQLFFISFAQTMCINMRDDAMVSMIQRGSVSPSQFRVVGSLQNSHDFSLAFGCQKNDFMNPQKKCYVW